MTKKPQIIILLLFLLMCGILSAQSEDDAIRLLRRFREPKKPQIDDHRPRIAVVLSGGGALGLAHIGALQALEEIGIKPDYVTGTSMGAIIGGLYAIGYDPYQLEQLAYDIDWEKALSDEIPRSSIPFEEKESDRIYPLSFPIEGFDISLPQGLLSGQKLYELLTRLTVSAHHINDFNQLPIPFLCIATNIETGEPVILDDGYLPDALRASMSIPSMFIPIKLKGQTLVDGGLSCNLPASYADAMGADIIIAIDVGGNLSDEEDLNSLFKILAQTIAFHSVKCVDEERNFIDVYVAPKLHGYDFLDFMKADSLISHGISATLEHYNELKAIAKQQRQYPTPPEPEKLVTPDAIYISSIRTEGLERTSGRVLLAYLQVEPGTWVTTQDLESAIDRLYGTGDFDLVNYRLAPAEDGVELIIKAVERKVGQLRVGVNYNSDLKAALMLNMTFKNLWLDGARLSLDLKLSENYAWKTEYFYYPGWKPGLGLKAAVNGEKMDIWLYGDDGTRYAFYDYEMEGQQITVQTVSDNRISAGLGVELFTSDMDLKAQTVSYFPHEINSTFVDYIGFLTVDTYDRSIYPNQGIDFYIEARGYYGMTSYNGVPQYTGDADIEQTYHFKRYYGETRNVVPLAKKWALTINGYSGGVVGDKIPDEFHFFMGGQHMDKSRFIPMLGLEWMHRSGRSALSYDLGIRYEIFRNVFLSGRAGAGKVCGEYMHLITSTDDYIVGYGISAGARTPIGPVEVIMMDSTSKRGKMSWYVLIGSEM